MSLISAESTNLYPKKDSSVKQHPLTRFQAAYFYVYLLAIVLCWSPSNIAGYLAPWIGIGGFIVLSRSRLTLQNLLLLLSVWIFILPIYAILTPQFAWHSAVLTLLTYGSVIFAIVVPSRALANDYLKNRMFGISSKVLLFQACWGIGQAIASFMRRGTFDGASGDAVAGTIRPFAVYPDFSNPMFAVNMSLLLLVLFPYLFKSRQGQIQLIIGAVSLVLASVLHVLLFLAVAIAITFLWFYPSFLFQRQGLTVLIGIGLLGLIATNLLSNNFATVQNFARYTLEGRTVRAQVVVDVFTKMPGQYPWMPIIGLGPGQFTSRASLIGTGLYFGGPQNPRSLPLLPEGMSQPFSQYVLDRWISITADGLNNSSTSQPYFSWLSIYTEFGALGFFIVIAFVVWRLLKLRRLQSRVGYSQKLATLSLIASTIFLFALGIQENYWEVSQALFVGILLFKMNYACLQQDTRQIRLT